MPNFEKKVGTYCQTLEQLNPGDISGLLGLCSANIEFKDPFNHTHTLAGFENVLIDLFEKIPNARFDVTAINGSDCYWMIKWQFCGHAGRLGHLDFTGMSELKLDQKGRMCCHIDYWDSGENFWQHVPILKTAMSLIKRRLKVHDSKFL